MNVLISQTVNNATKTFNLADNVNWFAQQITMPVGSRSISGVDIKIDKATNGGGVDEEMFTLSIRSSLTGSDLVSDTQLISSNSGTHVHSFTFSSPLTVTDNDIRYIVFRRITLSGGVGGNLDAWYGSSSSVYPGGIAYASTDSGSSFSAATGVLDFYFVVSGVLNIPIAVSDSFAVTDSMSMLRHVSIAKSDTVTPTDTASVTALSDVWTYQDKPDLGDWINQNKP